MNESTRNAMFSSESCEWGTPQETFDELNDEFGISLDVCASKENAKRPLYFTAEDDCLKQDWVGFLRTHGLPLVGFMNPKYGNPEFPCPKNCKKKKCAKRGRHCLVYDPGIIDFMRKAHEEAQKGMTVVCLPPARTDTQWWHRFVEDHEYERRFIEGRLVFTSPNNPEGNPAPFPSAIVIMRPGAK